MGRNRDFTEYGMTELICPQCKESIDLTEIDIDCDLQSHHPNCFNLNLQCEHCNMESRFDFEIVHRER